MDGVALLVPQWLLQAEVTEALPALKREPDLKTGVKVSSETFKYYNRKKILVINRSKSSGSVVKCKEGFKNSLGYMFGLMLPLRVRRGNTCSNKHTASVSNQCGCISDEETSVTFHVDLCRRGVGAVDVGCKARVAPGVFFKSLRDDQRVELAAVDDLDIRAVLQLLALTEPPAVIHTGLFMGKPL